MNVKTLIQRILDHPNWTSKDFIQHMDSEGNFHNPHDILYENGKTTDRQTNQTFKISIGAGIFLERLAELMFLTDLKKRFIVHKNKFGVHKPICFNDDFLNSSINRGSSGGVIDIILETKETKDVKTKEKNGDVKTNEKWIVVSSKCFDRDEKPMDKYDIGNIYTYIHEEVHHLFDSTQIGVVVRDKSKWMENYETSRSKKYLGKLAKDFVRDFHDIDEWLDEFRYHFKTVQDVKQFCVQKKPKMKLRIHQKVLADRVVKNCVHSKTHLIPAVCRSGKSYMIAEIIRQFIPTKKKFLYITNRPSETFLQIKEDIFDKFCDFVLLTTTILKTRTQSNTSTPKSSTRPAVRISWTCPRWRSTFRADPVPSASIIRASPRAIYTLLIPILTGIQASFYSASQPTVARPGELRSR